MTTDPNASRRELLAAGGGALFASLGLPALALAAPAAAAPASYDSRLQALRALGPDFDVFTKMRADLRETAVLYLTRGLLYAYLNDATAPLPVPLMGAEGLTFTRHVRIDGGWRQLMHEVVYYTDFMTHAVLDEMRNPVTGKLVEAKHYRARQTLDFVRGTLAFPPLPPGFESRSHTTQPLLQGGFVYMHEHIMAREPPPAPGAPLRRIDSVLAIYASPLDDVLDRARSAARCTCQFGIIGRFPAWLQMDDVPGRIAWAGHSTKLAGLDEVTPWLKARIERDHPDYLSQPQV